MIFTDKHVIFGSYGGFPSARTEIYRLSDFDSVLIADSYNDSTHSKIIGFSKNNEFPIDLRKRFVGKGFGNMPIEDFNEKMQLVAGHIPVCETGEVFESHTQYFYGIGFSQSLG
jgi:hypothetical protein